MRPGAALITHALRLPPLTGGMLPGVTALWWRAPTAEEEEAHRVESSSEFEQDDSWIPLVAEWFKRQPRGDWFTLADVFQGALMMEPSKQRRTDQMRLAGVLRALGCEKKRRMVAGARSWFWRMPDQPA